MEESVGCHFNIAQGSRAEEQLCRNARRERHVGPSQNFGDLACAGRIDFSSVATVALSWGLTVPLFQVFKPGSLVM